MNSSLYMLVNAVGWTLIHFLWQGALVGAATALALAALRYARPATRYAVCCGALLACLGWPALELHARLAAHGADALLALSGAGPSMHGGDAGVLNILQRNLDWIVGIWAVCALMLALRIAAGLLWIARAGRSEQVDPHWQRVAQQLAARFGVTRTVRLRVVAGLASPVTAGCWRPLILLPAALVAGMPPELLEALLAHEMAHVSQYDYLVNLIQNVIETLLFYHPAVWWISNRIRVERELIADDFAARQLGEPRRLALALSELERIQFSPQHLALAANGGDLMVRIKRLLKPDTTARSGKAALPLLAIAALGLAAWTQIATAETQAPAHQRALVDFASCAKPVWPAAALAAKETGTVKLNFLVDVDGRVNDAKVLGSSGHPALDEAARDGIRQCHFRPATDGGKPVKEWVKVQYVWTLE